MSSPRPDRDAWDRLSRRGDLRGADTVMRQAVVANRRRRLIRWASAAACVAAVVVLAEVTRGNGDVEVVVVAAPVQGPALECGRAEVPVRSSSREVRCQLSGFPGNVIVDVEAFGEAKRAPVDGEGRGDVVIEVPCCFEDPVAARVVASNADLMAVATIRIVEEGAGCAPFAPATTPCPEQTASTAPTTGPAATTDVIGGSDDSTAIDAVSTAPSQSDTDAARDQIVPEVAALTLEVRVHQIEELFGQTRVDTEEGTWIISEPRVDPGRTDGCTLGDPDGIDGLDRICVYEYAEILLLSPETGQIIRAYPFPGLPPQSLQRTSDALYCIRQGDGGLPDSMLCRIDLTTLDATVRVFPSALDSGFSPSLDRWTPATWTLDQSTDLILWQHLDTTGAAVTISGLTGTATIDPQTLALVAVDETTRG